MLGYVRAGVLVLILMPSVLLNGSASVASTDQVPIDEIEVPPIAYHGVPMAVNTDGDTVAWRSFGVDEESGDILSYEILAADIDKQQRTTVASGPVEHSSPNVSGPVVDGDFVVWSEDAPTHQADSLWAYRLSTESTAKVAQDLRPIDGFDVQNDWVVWLEPDDTTARIMARNVADMSEPLTLATGMHSAPEGSQFGPPVTDGRWVVWSDGYRSEAGVALVAYDLLQSEMVVLVEPEESSLYLRFQHYAVEAGKVTYLVPEGTTDPAGLTVDFEFIDLATGEESSVTISGADYVDFEGRYAPYLAFDGFDGRYLYWSVYDEEPSTVCCEYALWAYDLKSRSIFPLLSGTNLSISVASGTLAWSEGATSQGRYGIHAAPLAQFLPTASVPNDRPGSADWTYHPETGHFVSFGFKAFWERNGGLPVFGYPLTEEFEQENRDSGQRHTVQFFERQRFEWHDENAGTRYEVLLGRLGAEAAAREDLLGTEPFEPRSADEIQPSHCQSFNETTHLVCLPFSDYWSSHGLDLGDPGTSFRESLALFGYPISEAFVEAESGLLVQYFERAVFEYHEDNSPAHQVLLRRLGAEMLAQYGW